MNLFHRIILILTLTSTALVVCLGQDARMDQDIKELKGLKGSAFINKAVGIAEDFGVQGNNSECLKYFDKAIDAAARTKNQSTVAVVAIRKSAFITSRLPHSDDYVKSSFKSIKKALSNNDNPIVISQLGEALGKLRPRATEQKLVNDIQKELDKISDRVEVTAQKKFNQLSKEEAFDLVENIKSTQQGLQQSQFLLQTEVSKLADIQDRLNRDLDSKSSLLNQMTKEKLEAQALIEYNRRLIDSMSFEAELDSMDLVYQQSLIKEQKSDLKWQESQLILKNSQRNLFLALSAIVLLTALMVFMKWRASAKFNEELRQKNLEIAEEKEESERLLLNILPKNVAKELKEKGHVSTQYFDQVSVMFADFVGFSQISKRLSPAELVETLDSLFNAFDTIVEKYSIEKIKTIGDEYMCACGVPVPQNDNAGKTTTAAIEIQDFIKKWNEDRKDLGLPEFNIRIGIHTGPIITGVVGKHKFAYDIWGDTVNIASRLESASQPGMINISEDTAALLADKYKLKSRGKVEVKNMDPLEMYYVKV